MVNIIMHLYRLPLPFFSFGKLLFAIIFSSVLFGCSAKVAMVNIPPVKEQPVLKATPQNALPVFIHRIENQIANPNIGQKKHGTLCGGGKELIWTPKSSMLKKMTVTIQDTLKNHGYKISKSILESRAKKLAHANIQPTLKDAKANLCYSIDGKKGEVSVTILWVIKDKYSKTPVTITTQGYSKKEAFTGNADTELFLRAIEMATKNFLASKKVYLLLTR